MKLTDHTFKTINFKGKPYIEVKERLEYLSKKFDGEYSINTEYQYFEASKLWVVKATLTLKQGELTSTYTGLGQEIQGGAGVNSTSALENAETSAVGRACAMAGIGIDISIASADEIIKATNRELTSGTIKKSGLTENTEKYLTETAPKQPVEPLDMSTVTIDLAVADTLAAVKAVWESYPNHQTNATFKAAVNKRKAELTKPAKV